jgi:hypothetical protein
LKQWDFLSRITQYNPPRRPDWPQCCSRLASAVIGAEPPVAETQAVPLDALGDLTVAAWPPLVVFVHGYGRIGGACLIEAGTAGQPMGGTDFQPGQLEVLIYMSC